MRRSIICLTTFLLAAILGINLVSISQFELYSTKNLKIDEPDESPSIIGCEMKGFRELHLKQLKQREKLLRNAKRKK